jgi:hypothetical protein
MAEIAVAHTPAADAAPKDHIASLAGQLRHASTGTLARLRRFHPLQHPQASLFDAERLLQAAHVVLRPDDADRARWALLLHCLALAQGAHEPRADAEPGAVLARLRFSEARVRQLVEADEQVLAALLPRLARRLAAAGAAVNWWPLAQMLLHTASADPSRQALADAARQRIVRHYVAAQSRAAAAAVPEA